MKKTLTVLIAAGALLGAAIGREPRFERAADPSPSGVADIELLRATLGMPRVGVAEGIAREWGPRA